MKKLFEQFYNNKVLSIAAKICGALMPRINNLKKYKNILKTVSSINAQKLKITSNPISIRIAPICVCNYSCQFCEIHKDNLLYPNRSRNEIDLEFIHNYEFFLSTAYFLNFYGGSEEPLLNKNFGNFVQYIKQKYGTKMTVITNASMLNKNLSDILINHKFDTLLVSYHAASKEGYKMLMTGKVERVNQNLNYLKNQKNRLAQKKPVVQFNFALQRLNAKEYPLIFKNSKKFDVSKVIVNKYYGGRNLLQDKNVAYDYDTEEGNQLLDEIYAHAKQKNINLHPKKPSYWSKLTSTDWSPENFVASKKCFLPWTDLHFNPVLDDNNCHYVGICNRIELFKIAYDKIQFRTQEQFNLLWNHAALQYLRNTVNTIDTINPICKYCKNVNRETLRNVDAQKYAEIRDIAVQNFFKELRRLYRFDEIKGITVLEENPNNDAHYRDALKAKSEN